MIPKDKSMPPEAPVEPSMSKTRSLLGYQKSFIMHSKSYSIYSRCNTYWSPFQALVLWVPFAYLKDSRFQPHGCPNSAACAPHCVTTCARHSCITRPRSCEARSESLPACTASVKDPCIAISVYAERVPRARHRIASFSCDITMTLLFPR